jgi:hypothetical protein
MDQSHDPRIALAIAEIGDQNAPNYAQYARKYKLDRSTLSRRLLRTEMQATVSYGQGIGATGGLRMNDGPQRTRDLQGLYKTVSKQLAFLPSLLSSALDSCI